MSHNVLFEKAIGNWEGNCRAWFELGKLADESKVTGASSIRWWRQAGDAPKK